MVGVGAWFSITAHVTLEETNHVKLAIPTAWAALILIILIGVSCSKKESPSVPDTNIDYYTCAMHPSVREKKPGPCPICGMEMVPVMKQKSKAVPSASPAAGGDHSQHLPKVSSTDAQDAGNTASPSVVATPSSSEPETTSFQVAPERLQAIGIRSDVIRREKLQRLLRAPGIVTIDESTLRDINIKTADGYIEKLFADYTGKKVNKDEPLALILSEGWIEAQQDYIKAYRAWRRTRVLMANENSIRLEQEINRMRARLRVWDLTEEQIKKLEDLALHVTEVDLTLRRGQGQGLSGFFELLSPITGIIIEKNAIEGAKFERGATLFKLAELSPIWIEAEFPEDQSPYMGVGHEFDVSFPALPGLAAKARVAFIYPQVDAGTRRLKARFVLQNPEMKLLPGMYANVSCGLEFGEKLAVPFDAVIPTGDRFVVFLDHGGGKLEPRFVKVGEKLGNSYEVLEGLVEGDRVITSANFLIDSESRIQGALKMWGGGSGAGAVDPHAGHGKP